MRIPVRTHSLALSSRPRKGEGVGVCLIALAVALLALLRPASLPAQDFEDLGPDPLVERVVLRGVESLDEGAVRDAIRTRPIRCRTVLLQPFCWFTDAAFFKERHRLDRDELPRDVLRIRVYHWLRGYRDAEAAYELEPLDDGVEIRFFVDEGPPTLTRSVEVVQDSAIVREEELDQAELPPVGQPLDYERLEEAAEYLRDALRERGYANAVAADSVVVDSLQGAPAYRQADVRIELRPGNRVTIAEVLVEGNEEVSEETILRSLGLRAGDLFRQSDLDEAQRRLYRSNLFRQSAVTTLQQVAEDTTREDEVADEDDLLTRPPTDEPDPDPGDSTRIVVAAVREAPFDEVGLGAGMTTVQFGEVQAQYGRHNFLGGGRRVEVRTTVGNLLARQLHDQPVFNDALPQGVGADVESAFFDPTWSASVDFTQPWFYSHDNSLTLGLFGRRRAVLGVVIDHSFGGRATFTRQVGRGMPASLTYRFEETRTEAGGVYFCINFGICEPRTITALQRFHRLSPLTFRLMAQRVDQPTNPERGFTVDFEAEHASGLTASDYRYQSATVEGTYYQPVGSGVLAGRVRLGWVRPISGTERALGIPEAETALLHPRKRMYAGGARSVRGYGENQLGPRILTVAGSELLEEDPESGEACTEASLRDGTCDPGVAPTASFQPRPLGGNRVAEATLEYRFPLFGNLGGAVFVDAGHVGDLDLNIPTGARSAVTPGFGVRYPSPVGMIRADLGVRPTLVERLPVVTGVEEDGERRLVRLENLRRYDPTGGSGGLLEQVYRRLALHLSIGEAF